MGLRLLPNAGRVRGEPRGDVTLHPEKWGDAQWWDDAISEAVDTEDGVLGNARITQMHYELSEGLRAVLGKDAGANFHSWAVWGSRKARSTIQRNDVPGIRSLGALAGGALGLTAHTMRALWWPPAIAGAAFGAVQGGVAGWRDVEHLLDTSARQILGGNRTVLDDIGRQSGRYVATFLGNGPDPSLLAGFLEGVSHGPPPDGQDLLKEAFAHWTSSRRAPDIKARHELMLLGNLKVILHEHHRLQPYIEAAMPESWRQEVTRLLLRFDIGDENLSVSRDVPQAGSKEFPITLVELENPELLAFMRRWDRTPNELAGSGARDWAVLEDRMNYIVDLFRTRHLAAGLFAEPSLTD